MKDSYRSTRRLDRLTLAHLFAATLGVMVVLVTMGLIIRHLGVSAADASQMVKLMKVAPIDSASAAGTSASVTIIEASAKSDPSSQPSQTEQADHVVMLGFAAPPAVNADTIEAAAPARQAVQGLQSSGSHRASFNHRRLRKVRTITMTVTAYSPDAQSCGDSADGITASGYSVWTNGMKRVAADSSVLPFGSVISVPGYNGGRPVPVLDRGGAIKGNHIDLLFPTNEQAMQWGVKHLTVTVWAYAD